MHNYSDKVGIELSSDTPGSIRYPLMEDFLTLQGEGTWTGTSAYFIRLGGCDVGCHWCDVKESWDTGKHPLVSVDEIVSRVKNTNAKRVVITGGEPFFHDLNPLTSALKQSGLIVHCETAGVYPVTGEWDWICFSPKKFKAPLPEWYTICDELKVIVYNKHDLEWAMEQATKCTAETQLFLQPEWSKQDFLPEIVTFIKDHPEWRLSLQTHKFLGIP